MCKIINSDSVIGNFVIESIQKNNFKIEIEKLYDFDEQLSQKLIRHDYYTNFDAIKLMDFQENYSFLIESMEDSCFHIVQQIESIEKLQTLLNRYFRLGMPKVVVDEMKEISQIILG